jgi:mitogen-activated protein kinase kinase
MASRGSSGVNLPPDILARIQAVNLGRRGAPPTGLPDRGPMALQRPSPSVGQPGPMSPTAGSSVMTNPMSNPMANPNLAGVPAGFRPPMGSMNSAPAIPGRAPAKRLSMAERRAQKAGAMPSDTGAAAGKKNPMGGMSLSNVHGDAGNEPKKPETMMDKYSEYLNKQDGTLHFKDKAILGPDGVQFESGTTFHISLDEVDTLDELGKGNYGTVYKVRHSRPKMRKPGQGLAGNKAAPGSPSRQGFEDDESSSMAVKPAAGTGIVMAMKEMRLELDDSKFASIIMELDVLHRCVSPYIVDFYGAFFQEGAVYICMEFMDGGSIDKLYHEGVPEGVLRKITLATTMGLKSLKDEHNIIHRDVKPTNILMNTKGQIKICDFGVSGNLVASIAKTNIGCQSYMAPERISSGGVAQAGANPGGGTYSVQSDIWSLGLTIIECALGRYPYPPETYNNIFSQLSVSGYHMYRRPRLTEHRQLWMANPQICPRKVTLMRRATLYAAVCTRSLTYDRHMPCFCNMRG